MIKSPNFYQLTIGIVLFSASLFITSCDDKKKDPEPVVVDSTKPTVSITSPTANETLTGTKTIQIQATDNIAVVKVEVFIDNVSINSLTTAPYNFDWNTTTAVDGVHIIKAIASDGAGNQQEAKVSVTVQNNTNTLLLLTVNVADGTIGGTVEPYLSKGWVVLHDKDWNIITSGELKSGESLKLYGPESFTDNNFTMTQILVLQESGKTSMIAEARLQVVKGTVLPLSKGTELGTDGFANVSFTNAGTGVYYNVSTNGGQYYSNDLSSYTYNNKSVTEVSKLAAGQRALYMTKSPTRLYIRQNSEVDNRFFMTNATINKDGTYAQDLNVVNNADDSHILDADTIDVSATPGVGITLYGLTTEGDLKEAYNIGTSDIDFESNTVIIQYPKASTNTFAQYFSETIFDIDENTFAYNSSDGKYDLTPLAATGSFQNFTTTSADITTSGTFDAFLTVFSIDGDTLNQIYLTGPVVNNQSIQIPPIPAAIKDQLSFVNYDEFKIEQGIDFYDYKFVDGYQDLLAKQYDGSFTNYYHVKNLNKYFGNLTIGRKQSRSNTKHSCFDLWSHK